MRKLLIVLAVLMIFSASNLFAAKNITNVTLAFDKSSTIARSITGGAMNLKTGHIIVSDWTFAGWTATPPRIGEYFSCVDGSKLGNLLIDSTTLMYTDMTTRNGYPMMGYACDNDGVIWGYFEGTRFIPSGTYTGQTSNFNVTFNTFIRFATEDSLPTFAPEPSFSVFTDTLGYVTTIRQEDTGNLPDFTRAGTAVGGWSEGNLRVGFCGNSDTGRIRIFGTRDGLNLVSVDTIPSPAAKVGVAFDPRYTDYSGFPNVVYGSEPWAAPDVFAYKHVKMGGAWSQITAAAYPGIWNRSSTEFTVYIASISTTTTVVLTNPSNVGCTVDVPWGIYIAHDYYRQNIMFSDTDDAGLPLGDIWGGSSGPTDYPQMRNGSSICYNQPLVVYLDTTTHRVITVMRHIAGSSGIIGWNYQIDYTPTNSLEVYTNPLNAITSPGGSVTINALRGVIPYTWSFVDSLGGSLDTTIGSVVVYTASTTPGTAQIKVTDAGFQERIVNIYITTTSAPLASESEIIPAAREVIRFELFE
ncbi:MAG: hypothetical protein ACE14V_12145 [bacterium]